MKGLPNCTASHRGFNLAQYLDQKEASSSADQIFNLDTATGLPSPAVLRGFASFNENGAHTAMRTIAESGLWGAAFGRFCASREVTFE